MLQYTAKPASIQYASMITLGFNSSLYNYQIGFFMTQESWIAEALAYAASSH